MITIILSCIILLLFPSCSPENRARDVYLVTVADDFTGYSKLENVVTDQAALINQLRTIFPDIRIHAYTSQDGKRYYSTHPVFRATDKSGNEVESGSALFERFSYVESSADSVSSWTMEDVLGKTVGGLATGENDLIIFTYSGHGDENGSLLTNAGKSGYMTTNKERVIEAFSSIPGKKVFFLDSCFSGMFIDGSTLVSKDTFSSDGKIYKGEDVIGALKTDCGSSSSSCRDIWIMASASKEQEAKDYCSGGDSVFQRHYGSFTYYLLKALGYNTDRNESADNSSALSFYSIYCYIRSVFPETELEIQTPQATLKRLDILLK